jgi:uncharacterized repeat protein (TIGR01451 family)
LGLVPNRTATQWLVVIGFGALVSALLWFPCKSASFAGPVCPPSLNYGDTIVCSIDLAGEVDAYTLEGIAGERVLLRMLDTSPGGVLDAEIRVLRPNSTQLCGAVGSALAETLCTLDTTGTYTVLASDSGNNQVGTYSLHIQRTINPSGAEPLALDTAVASSITTAPELDAYTFTGAVGDRMLIRMLDTSGSAFDAEFRVFRPNGTQLCSALSSGLAETTCALDANGTYTILAGELGGNLTGSYSLYVQSTTAPASATPLSFGDTVSGAITTAPELDAYTFTGAMGDRMLIRMLDTSGSAFDAEFRVFRPNGTQLCSALSSGLAETTCALDANGSYTILAGELGGNLTGSYSLYLQSITSPANATPLSFGDISAATIDTVPELNAYTFVGTQNDQVLLRMLDTSAGAFDPEFRVYRPNGTQLCGGISATLAEAFCTLDTTGTYTVLAGELGGDLTGSYQLTLDCAALFCGPQESGVDLGVRVMGLRRASPGQTITYVIEYGNNGLQAADQAVLFNQLDEATRFVSASAGAIYNPVLHTVDWDVGQLSAKEDRSVSVDVEIAWGLPQGTELEYRADIFDVGSGTSAQAVQAAQTPTGPRLYANGIGNCGGSVAKNDEFSRNLGAFPVVLYNQNCEFGTALGRPIGLDQDIDDVQNADNFVPTPGNGLENPLVNERSYGECWAYSGGTVTVTSAIERRGLRCKSLQLISPYLLSKEELTNLHAAHGVEDVTIWQSDTDKPAFGIGQFKFNLANAQDQEYLNNNPWVHVENRPGVQHAGEPGWLFCFNRTVQYTGQLNCDPVYLTAPESSEAETTAVVARDPNAKHVDREFAEPGGPLNFTVEFENEGEGIAFGVFVSDTLHSEIDASTLLLPPEEGGWYEPTTRTIRWFIGEVGPGGAGELHFSAAVREGAPCGADITNVATVHFPSVPEVTPTNGVSIKVTGPECDLDKDGVLDTVDNCPDVPNGTAQANITGVGNQANADSALEPPDGKVGDACDSDDDNDGLDDAVELHLSTSPENPDSDEDGIQDGDEDTDGDGCTNSQEANAPRPDSGGWRDPANYWDFFDVPTPPNLTYTKNVTVGDLTAVVARFGSVGDPTNDPRSSPPAEPAYHPAFDRTLLAGGDPWDTNPPDGTVTILDITLLVKQFGHTCVLPE